MGFIPERLMMMMMMREGCSSAHQRCTSAGTEVLISAVAARHVTT